MFDLSFGLNILSGWLAYSLFQHNTSKLYNIAFTYYQIYKLE
jgi:hypothetical protein